MKFTMYGWCRCPEAHAARASASTIGKPRIPRSYHRRLIGKDLSESRVDREAAVAVAELDRLGVTDRARLVEQPARDRVGERVLVACVPQPRRHVAAGRERVR